MLGFTFENLKMTNVLARSRKIEGERPWLEVPGQVGGVGGGGPSPLAGQRLPAL